jgi:hypothetical protein
LPKYARQAVKTHQKPVARFFNDRHRKALLRQAKRQGAANHSAADDNDICCMNCHGYYP